MSRVKDRGRWGRRERQVEGRRRETEGRVAEARRQSDGNVKIKVAGGAETGGRRG